MTFSRMIAELLLPPIMLALLAGGITFKFFRSRRARARPDGWRVARVGLGGRVFGGSAIGFAVLLPTMEPLSPGEELGYMLAVIHVVMIGAALVIRYMFFFRVAWDEHWIDHRGLWRRRNLAWRDVVGAGYSKGIGVCLVDRRRRRFWVPVHLDGFAEFCAYVAERTGLLPEPAT
jgi:hypothetical protein